jgi:hypothetical protein
MGDVDDVVNLNQILYAKSVSTNIKCSTWNTIRNYDLQELSISKETDNFDSSFIKHLKISYRHS